MSKRKAKKINKSRANYEKTFKKLRAKQKVKLAHQYLMENW